MSQIVDKYLSKKDRFKIIYGSTENVAINRSEELLLLCQVINKSAIKRINDILISSIVLITIFSWLYPLIALAIKITSKGPVLFLQEREGINKKCFKCLKFRTMKADSRDVDESGKYLQASNDDKRITKVGKFLRKTSLDEMPQFINVLKGEMSIIGPRPHPVPLNRESEKNIPGYNLRHLVKPGITGLAQVSGYRGETKDIELMIKRVECDICYIKYWKPSTEVKILYKTVVNILTGDSKVY